MPLALLAACASSLFSAQRPESSVGKSIFIDTYGAFYFMSAQEALSAYAGVWGGRQELFSGGQKMAEGMIQQQYVPDRLKPGTLAGLAKISLSNGRSALTRSSMGVKNGELRLEVYAENGSVDTYLGVFESNTITWIQYPIVKNLDVQIDSFVATPDGAALSSRGFRYISVKDSSFSGFIISKTDLKRESLFPKPVEQTSVPNADKLFKTPRGGAFGN